MLYDAAPPLTLLFTPALYDLRHVCHAMRYHATIVFRRCYYSLRYYATRCCYASTLRYCLLRLARCLARYAAQGVILCY